MKKASFLLLLWMSFASLALAQDNHKDYGNIHLYAGTILITSSYSVGYEFPDLISSKSKHAIRPVIRFGGWYASLFTTNSGIQSSIGFSYLYGSKSHLFEHSSEMVAYFDRMSSNQSLTYMNILYRTFFGYRYQPIKNKLYFKVGIGFIEVLQVGFGYRF